MSVYPSIVLRLSCLLLFEGIPTHNERMSISFVLSSFCFGLSICLSINSNTRPEKTTQKRQTHR